MTFLTLNFERRTPNLGRSFPFSTLLLTACGSNAGCENANQFLGFRDQRINLRRGLYQRHAFNQTQPAVRFAKFLVANAQFVNEIFSRFSRLRLAMIWQRRRSAAKKLSRYMITGSG